MWGRSVINAKTSSILDEVSIERITGTTIAGIQRMPEKEKRKGYGI